MLVIICGLPGTGKSTLAQELAKRWKAIHISSDSVRLRILKERTYSEKEKQMVYEKMFEEARGLLKRGADAILDATFYQKNLREAARAMAETEKNGCILIECVLGEEKIKERMERRKMGKNESEATFEIYKKVKEEFEEIEEKHLVINTEEPMEKQIEKAGQYASRFGSYGNHIYTHISDIYIIGNFVYKVKKPVKFSFLDFSTKELRRFYCEEEVRLNKRLCPDIYLGVVRAEKHFGGYIFGENTIKRGEEADAEEYAVKMKKMPMERQMDKLLEKGEVSADDVVRLAEIIAEFHKKADRIKDKKYGDPLLIKRQVDDIAKHLGTIEKAAGTGKAIDYALKQCSRFHEKNIRLFKKRQEEGFVRECHGDLHSANVILADKTYIFDCIEFNPDFRNIDVASEIAFMAMDLDAHDRRELADAFVDRYIKATNDKDALLLLNYYKCYRANVRAKVAAIEYSQKADEDSKKRIAKYTKLMEEYARELNKTKVE